MLCRNPMWSVGTILTGLLSFMNEAAHTTGSISSTKAEKRRFAKMSLEYNLRNPMFRKLFPEYQEEFHRRKREEEVLDSLPAGPKTPSAKQSSALVSGFLTRLLRCCNKMMNLYATTGYGLRCEGMVAC